MAHALHGYQDACTPSTPVDFKEIKKLVNAKDSYAEWMPGKSQPDG